MECSKNMKTGVALNENSVEEKPCINRESKRGEITIYLYSCHDITMKLLVVVTPPSSYHGCSTWKTLWEEKFPGNENFVSFCEHAKLWLS